MVRDWSSNMVGDTDSLQWNALLFTGMLLSFLFQWTRAHRWPCNIWFLVWTPPTELVIWSRDGSWTELYNTLNLRSEMFLSQYVISSKGLVHIKKRGGHTWFQNLFFGSLPLRWLRHPRCLGLSPSPKSWGILPIYWGIDMTPISRWDSDSLGQAIIQCFLTLWSAKEALSSMGILRPGLARFCKCCQIGRGSMPSLYERFFHFLVLDGSSVIKNAQKKDRWD